MNTQKNNVTKGLVFVAVIALILFGFTYANNSDREVAEELAVEKCGDKFMTQDLPKTNEANPVVTFCTNMGDISIELYMDRTPITAGNFLKLAEEGYYTGTKFHRVIDNFMIQGGDPNTKGDDTSTYGKGGPGYTIEDEFDPELSNLRGTLSMANIGQPNSGGSQFFINYVDNTNLDFDKQPFTSKHPVFGHVVAGLDIVDSIIKVETGPGDMPVNPIVINEVGIISSEEDGETVGQGMMVPGFEGEATDMTVEETSEENIETEQ